MKRVAGYLAITSLLLWTGLANAFEVRQLMNLLAAVPASNARFTETRHSSLLKEPLVLEGHLVYRRPSRLERHVESPYRESIVIEDARITITKDEGAPSRSFRVPEGAAEALVESLRATLAGDAAALEKHFTASVAGREDAWTLTLVPREAALSDIVKRVEISGAHARLASVEVIEGGGDRSVMLLKDAR